MIQTLAEQTSVREPRPSFRPRLVSSPVLVFTAVESFALVLWMAVGRSEWFYLDDWDFVAARRTRNLADWFRPHNEHWVTVPVLIYRVLFWRFGLRTYVPYRLVGVLVYLAAAALLYVVIRRAGVDPWIAVTAGSLFALFGAGAQNIVRPFQMSFTGALAFGLLHVVLADHDGPFDRRDAFGLLAGLVSLLMSGIAVSMAVVVGLAVWLRRGPRLAVVHTAPLGGCYLAWWLLVGHTGSALHLVKQDSLSVRTAYGFIEMGLRGAFTSIGHVAFIGAVLLVVLVAGLPIAWVRRDRVGRAQLAVPVALLAGSVVALGITALGRASFGADYARIPRYVSVTSAFVLPALAVAVDAVTSHRRFLVPLGVAVFLVGLQPTLLNTFFHSQPRVSAADAGTRNMMLTLPRDPTALRVPRSVRPDPFLARPVTIGWLLDGVAQHRIPAPSIITSEELRSDNFRLSFDQEAGRSPTTNCQTPHKTLTLSLAKGDAIGVFEHAVLLLPEFRLDSGVGLQFLPGADKPVTVLRNVGIVRVVPEPAPNWPRVCVGRS